MTTSVSEEAQKSLVGTAAHACPRWHCPAALLLPMGLGLPRATGEGRLLPTTADNLKDNLKDNTFCLSTSTPFPITPLPATFSSFLVKAIAWPIPSKRRRFYKVSRAISRVYKRFITSAIWPEHSLVSSPRPQTQQNKSPKSSLPFPCYPHITLTRSMSLYKCCQAVKKSLSILEK